MERGWAPITRVGGPAPGVRYGTGRPRGRLAERHAPPPREAPPPPPGSQAAPLREERIRDFGSGGGGPILLLQKILFLPLAGMPKICGVKQAELSPCSPWIRPPPYPSQSD